MNSNSLDNYLPRVRMSNSLTRFWGWQAKLLNLPTPPIPHTYTHTRTHTHTHTHTHPSLDLF